MNRQERISERRQGRRQAGRRGFTLIELLVVILIILLVSAVVLPTLIPAISHRQASEAARILQGALVGARDSAINTNAPAGIRLLPDPVFNGINPNTATLDPTRVLAANRYIPIQLAPDYSEGKASVILPSGPATPLPTTPFGQPTLPYGGGPFLVFYPGGPLMVEECPVYQDPTTGNWFPNSPTSWFWNIRVGDRIQLGGASQTYVVVGPVWISPANPNPLLQGNPELFVNIGFPGSEQGSLVLTRNYGDPTSPHTVDYLLLVNGKDDNSNGYVDDGWDGVDNNGNLQVDEPAEWEPETWIGSLVNPPPLPPSFPPPLNNQTGLLNLSYIITRRPVVSPGARETPLPSNVVVDMTTWNSQYFNLTFSSTTGITYVSERSRLPVDPNTGNVDIFVYPNGTVVPTTLYSSPSSFGMNSAFYHFWLAERGDLFDPAANPGVPYLLPMVPGSAYQTAYPNANDPLGTRALTGERRLMTLYTRTGQLITNQVETFDASLPPNPGPNYPFLAPQQGIRGDTR
ncbi:MAG TPA: prepilin-type N-terminal cleavage/methylation domain-containing protein [Isosphaeraceae bacterium]|nr:prepilin-type N-terminal cleavage/methylation domain-containing protein [Isosphaeraceae bacterium]